jgi:biopolymer transport protein ExbD
VQTVSIDRNDVLKLNMDALTPADLESALSALRQKDPQVAVVVRAHRDLPLQKFISVMDVVQRAGITKVGVMTRPEED